MSAAKSAPQSKGDWELIEKLYRAGIASLREIAKDGGVTEGAIRKRAKRDGWTRDLAAKIQQKADDLVRKEAVRKQGTQLTAADERVVVEANAEVQFRIRMEHRQDIGRTRSLFRSMLEELEVASSLEGRQLITELFEAMHPQDDDADSIDAAARAGRLQRLFDKITAGPARIDGAKKLTEMLEKLVRMEREAFGIDDTKSGEGGFEELLKRLGQE